MFNGGAHENGTISKTVKTEKSVIVYPNPSHEMLTFRLIGDFEGAAIQLVNTNGTVVWNRNVADKETSIDWNHTSLPTGIYFYRIVQNGDAIKEGKLIIQR